MKTPALQRCEQTLQTLEERFKAMEAFSMILAGHVARNRNELQAARLALKEADDLAGPPSPQAQWFTPLLR